MSKEETTPNDLNSYLSIQKQEVPTNSHLIRSHTKLATVLEKMGAKVESNDNLAGQ